MKANRAVIAALAIFAAGAPAFPAEVLHRSNAFGMLLEPIPRYRSDEYQWVVSVEKTKDRETRRLLESGTEARRWETRSAGGSRQEESEFDHGTLSARRLFGDAGELLWEESYVDGKLSSKAISQFSGGRLAGVRTVAADGSLLFLEEYVLSTQGMLRQVRRITAEGAVASSRYVRGTGGISEERDRVGEITYITRYDTEARVEEKEKRAGDELAARTDFTFRSGTKEVASSEEKDIAAGTLTRRDFGEKGRLEGETVSAGSAIVQRTGYSWDADGRNTAKRRKRVSGIEEWRYTYAHDGELAREDYLRRGIREKVTIYKGKGERTEELYRDGELFLRVTYSGDTRAREEVFANGALVRTRSLP